MDDLLKIEAAKVEPTMRHCAILQKSGDMSASDMAGVFVLSYLGLRRPNAWSNGKLKSMVSSTIPDNVKNSSPLSIKISEVPGLSAILGANYLNKRFGVKHGNIVDVDEVSMITVLSVFDCLQLRGIKNNTEDYINKCIVHWAYGLRPCRLMFRVPTPMEVLRQQAQSSRVITMFIKRDELEKRHTAMLYYMDGMQNHAKDSFEFLTHDMKHMENFIDPRIHDEQVGFFKCMLKLSSSTGTANTLNSTADCSRSFSDPGRLDESLKIKDCQNNSILQEICEEKNYPEKQNDKNSRCNSSFSERRQCEEWHHTKSNTLDKISLQESTTPINSSKSFFRDCCGYDKQLWRELEYAISDMNCFSTHLMQYVLAKMIFATERFIKAKAIDVTSDIPAPSSSRNEEKIDDSADEISSDNSTFNTHLSGGSDGDRRGRTVDDDSETLLSKSHLMRNWLLLLDQFGMKRCHLEITNGTDGALSQNSSGLCCDEMCASTACNAFSAATGMVHTAFKERGPLTADEGAALRLFFQERSRAD